MFDWIPVTQFSVGQNRTDAILIPFPLSSTHIAIKVQNLQGRNWQKAGDLWQQFTGGVKGQNIFVPFKQQLAVSMDTALGDYYLRFQPVSYHKGLFVEVWKWAKPVISYSYFGDFIPTVTAAYSNLVLATPLTFLADGNITKLRFYMPSGETGSHTMKIWSNSGELLLTLPFDNSVAGWNEQSLQTPFAIVNGDSYRISVNVNTLLSQFVGSNPIAPNSSPVQIPEGLSGYYSFDVDAFPDDGQGDNGFYFADVIFEA